MKIKKFRGRNFKEVMEEVKRVLGEDALIISTKTVGNAIEVLAAADFDLDEVKEKEPRKGVEILEEIKHSSEPPKAVTAESDLGKLLVEMEEIKQILSDFVKRQSELDELKKELSEIKSVISKGPSFAALFEALDEEAISVFSRLREMEVEETVLKEILTEVKKNDLLPPADVAQHYIKDKILTRRFDPEKGVPFVFVGPTGVGKTTTVAKIASIMKFFHSKEVITISIDTYRIGATDQMRIYADLIGIDFFAVNTPKEFGEAVSFARDKVILVDTAGRSPKDEIRLSELSAFLSEVKEYRLFILIPFGARFKEAIKIFESFSIRKPDGVILTKLDETDVYGLPLNISVFLKVPIVFITTGQRVPEDIEPADPYKLAALILGGGS